MNVGIYTILRCDKLKAIGMHKARKRQILQHRCVIDRHLLIIAEDLRKYQQERISDLRRSKRSMPGVQHQDELDHRRGNLSHN